MPADRYTVTARVHGPIVSEDDLLDQALRGFGIVSGDRATRRQVSTAAMRKTLDSFLAGLGPLGASAMVVVDDEEGLPAAVTARLRALSELEVDGRRIVEVVGFGDGGSEVESASWFRVPLGAGIAIALLVCAMAIGLTALAYRSLQLLEPQTSG